jgi:hypothetical protein
MQVLLVAVLLLVISLNVVQGFAVAGAFRRSGVVRTISSRSSSSSPSTRIFALVPDDNTPSDAPNTEVDQQQQQPMISQGADATCD